VPKARDEWRGKVSSLTKIFQPEVGVSGFFHLEGIMVAISQLRLARLQMDWTLDDLFLRSKGKLSPARISRIERGISTASEEESRVLVILLGVTEETVVASGTTARYAALTPMMA
jgi:hypothetical protein